MRNTSILAIVGSCVSFFMFLSIIITMAYIQFFSNVNLAEKDAAGHDTHAGGFICLSVTAVAALAGTIAGFGYALDQKAEDED